MGESKDLELIFRALRYASEQHREQKRKDGISPYINHPIAVAEMIVQTAKVDDAEIVSAALLHDTVEDTGTTREELSTLFGERVASLVMECTDDKSLPKARRKELQVEHAPHKSHGAKIIKMADKISNISDITHAPPTDWPNERIVEYLNWSKRVVDGLRGANSELESLYDQRLHAAKAVHENK